MSSVSKGFLSIQGFGFLEYLVGVHGCYGLGCLGFLGFSVLGVRSRDPQAGHGPRPGLRLQGKPVKLSLCRH